MDNFGAINVFARVAEMRSFSAAAERLGMTPSGASRAVSRLEARLGTQLLHRTTRRVDLTRDGIEFYEHCRQILAEIDKATSFINRTGGAPRGRLRVQMPVGFGKRVIVPRLPRFVDRYPHVELDVDLNDRGMDLSREGIDVAVRVGTIRDSSLATRRLCHTRFVTCAAPGYLKKHGEPRTPAELPAHRCMGYFVPQTGQYREWEFLVNAVERSRSVHGNLNINNGEALLTAMLAGGGIATIATFVAAEAVARGALRVILRDFIAKGPDISIVYLPSYRQAPAVRAFIDFLVDLVPANPPWDAIIGPKFRPSPRAVRSVMRVNDWPATG